MKIPPDQNRTHRRAFSLTELLVVIAIIGIVTLVAIPGIRGIQKISNSKSKRNAQLTAEVSNNLTSLSVAHVLPESLGGVDATTRLLRTGIHIPEGPMKGTFMGIPSLPEQDIESVGNYLDIVFDQSGLRLEYDSSPGD